MYEYEPVVAKEKEGHSMPSRHVFSAFVIAMSFAYINWKFSIIFFVVATLIAIHSNGFPASGSVWSMGSPEGDGKVREMEMSGV